MPVKPTAAGGFEVTACVHYRRAHRRLPPGTTARDAKRVEAELIAALQAQQRTHVAEQHDPPLMAALAAYLEHARHLRSPDTAAHHAQRIGQWCERYTCSQARQAAAHIVRDMRGQYAAATINRSLGALKHGLRLLWDAGRTPVDHGAAIRRLPEHNARDTPPTLAQIDAIARLASPAVRAAIWIALLTGCRRGEVCQIRLEHIGPDRILVPAGHTKARRTRSVPIVPALRHWLAHLPLPIGPEGIKSGFRRAREAAGLHWVHFHDTRHTAATTLLELGTPLDVVRDVLGHSTIKTTERYAHAIVARQRHALERLGDLHQALHQGQPDAA